MPERHDRPSRFLRISATLAAAAMCAPAAAQTPSRTPAPLTNADGGTTMPVRVGQLLVVSLDASGGTGYDWRLVGTDGVAEAGPSTLLQPERAPGVVGGTVTRVFTLRIARPGEQAATFVLERPWLRGQGKVEAVTFILVGR